MSTLDVVDVFVALLAFLAVACLLPVALDLVNACLEWITTRRSGRPR